MIQAHKPDTDLRRLIGEPTLATGMRVNVHGLELVAPNHSVQEALLGFPDVG